MASVSHNPTTFPITDSCTGISTSTLFTIPFCVLAQISLASSSARLIVAVSSTFPTTSSAFPKKLDTGFPNLDIQAPIAHTQAQRPVPIASSVGVPSLHSETVYCAAVSPSHANAQYPIFPAVPALAILEPSHRPHSGAVSAAVQAKSPIL